MNSNASQVANDYNKIFFYVVYKQKDLQLSPVTEEELEHNMPFKATRLKMKFNISTWLVKKRS